MKGGRRIGLAVALSVGAHGLALALIVGTSLIGAWPTAPIEIEVNGMKMEEVRDLPLGAPAGARRPSAPPPPAAELPAKDAGAARPKPRPKPPAPEIAEATPDGDAPPRPQSVRSYAPEGSHVTVLLRVDRLRGTPYAALVDALLMRLPDRRDLLEGTDLDLYRDVDALLVATPDPLDPAVTFLAVRHHLTDGALRAALERGARATGRKLSWRTERGRPFAERHASASDPSYLRRDERLILLATPRLAVVAPPAYRTLILQGHPARTTGAGGAIGGDAGGAGGSSADAGAAADEHASWAALIRRIDAEDSIMPADGVAMLSAEDLFAARPSGGLNVAPGTRGTDEQAAGTAPPAPRAYGLPLPPVLTATLGIAPQPFADIDGAFINEADAVSWETEWPGLRHKLTANPLVVLTGFSGLLGRVTVTRAGATIHVHIDATEMEMVRVLQLVATQAFPLGG